MVYLGQIAALKKGNFDHGSRTKISSQRWLEFRKSQRDPLQRAE